MCVLFEEPVNMKLVHKRNVFLSSADMATGNRGQFVVQLPYDLVFDERMVFKMWLAQVNIRNTFFYIQQHNSTYFMKFGRSDQAYPWNPPDIDIVYDRGQPVIIKDLNGWTQLTLPYGFPSDREVAHVVDNHLTQVDPDTKIRCVYRYGRLHFTQINATADAGAALTQKVYLYFSSQTKALEGYGSCNYALGFSALDVVLPIIPAVTDRSDTRRNVQDNASYLPTEASMSPNLMDIDHISDVIIKTNLPSDNYSISEGTPSVTGTTVQIPIAVAPGANIIYHDEQGVNAIYERAKSVMNTLDVQVLDKHLKQLVPGHDWSFVLNIEEYEDVDAQVLEQLKKHSSIGDELIQLSKMTLLQNEFKAR